MSEPKVNDVKLQIREPFYKGFQALADFDQIVKEDRSGYFSTFVEMAILNVIQGMADEQKSFSQKYSDLIKEMEELMPKPQDLE